MRLVAEQLAAGDPNRAAGWAGAGREQALQSTWVARPTAVVYRGTGSPESYMTLARDVHSAYQNALRLRIGGDPRHGDCARNILNAWSATLTKIDGSSDRYLAAGIYGYQFANAAELMRGYPGFDLTRFTTMMTTVFYPLSSTFLREHNGAIITHYWANWDMVTIANVLAVGILTRDNDKIREARDYFRSGAGNGSLPNAVPTVLADGTAQWIEAGRDQVHTLMGVGIMATICEMAWNQGALVENHYVGRLRRPAPNVTAIARAYGVESGGGYGPNSGGYDALGFGTLTVVPRR